MLNDGVFKEDNEGSCPLALSPYATLCCGLAIQTASKAIMDMDMAVNITDLLH